MTGLVCGVDEAGRGPLVGTVVAAAVILDPSQPIIGLADSKKLSPKVRERLAIEIREKAIDWSIAEATAQEIDQINILQATMLAMKRAVDGLTIKPSYALIDGNRIPKGLSCAAEAIVKGDAKEAAISAASILAKTARDAQMIALDIRFPQYGFAKHMGYPTVMHLEALRLHGPIFEHRKSFSPVSQCLIVDIS